MTPKEKALDNYIREKHNQDECVGFIDGYTQCQQDMADVIKEIPQQGQVQYDLQRQLRELMVVANKLGLYDASDFLRPHCN